MKRQRLDYSRVRATGRGKYNLFKSTGRFTRALGNIALQKLASYGGGGAYYPRRYRGRGVYQGMGAYNANEVMNSNNLVIGTARNTSIGVGGTPPAFVSRVDETGAVTVSHREFVTDLYGPSSSFQLLSLPLNPGLNTVFKYLSQVAANYEEYEFVQLIFTYRSTTADIGSSTTGQVGSVIMATQYNATTADWPDKQAMLEYAHAMDCKVTEHMRHGVECDPKKRAGSRSKLVRASPPLASDDLHEYDWGKTQIAISNCPTAMANYVIGELWVDYTVRLRKPRLFVSKALNVQRDYFYFSPTFGGAGSNTPWASNTTTFLKAQQSNLNCSLTSLTAGAAGGNATVTIVFPSYVSGAFRITFGASYGGGTAAGTPGSSRTGNVSQFLDQFQGNSGVPVAQTYTSNTSQSLAMWTVAIQPFTASATANNNSVTLSLNFQGTLNITEAFLNIEMYNPLSGPVGVNPNLLGSGAAGGSPITFVNNSNGAVVVAT